MYDSYKYDSYMYCIAQKSFVLSESLNFYRFTMVTLKTFSKHFEPEQKTFPIKIILSIIDTHTYLPYQPYFHVLYWRNSSC